MIKIEKRVLLEGLKNVTKIIPRNPATDILQGILVECSNNNIAITGTDLNMAITTNLACQTEMFDEKYIVNAKLFYDIINKMSSSDIEISLLEENNLEIKGNKSKFSIKTLGGPSEFPSFEMKMENIETISISSDAFKEIINRTTPFTAKEDSRPILTGVLLEFTKNQVKGVSLDGYRLSHYVTEVENEIEKELIVQKDILINISRIIEGDTKISFDKNETKSIKFETGNTVIYTRILEGQFIDYKNILTLDEAKTSIKVDTEKLKAMIERVVVVSNSDFGVKPAVLSINTKENKLKITAKSEIAKSKEEIDIKAEGEDIEIALNPNFLLEGLKVIKANELEFKINGSLNPIFLLDNEDYVYFVLPIRLTNYEKSEENDDKVEEKKAS